MVGRHGSTKPIHVLTSLLLKGLSSISSAHQFFAEHSPLCVTLCWSVWVQCSDWQHLQPHIRPFTSFFLSIPIDRVPNKISPCFSTLMLIIEFEWLNLELRLVEMSFCLLLIFSDHSNLRFRQFTSISIFKWGCGTRWVQYLCRLLNSKLIRMYKRNVLAHCDTSIYFWPY